MADRLRTAAATSGGAVAAGASGSGGSSGGGALQTADAGTSITSLAAGAAAGQQGAGGGAAPNVVVLGLISEHCATSGDVGRPRSELERSFPLLGGALGDLDECWWYNPDPSGRPNCHK